MASGDRQNTDAKKSPGRAEKLTQAEQSERFKRAARELEVDESGDSFERAASKLLKAAPNPRR